MDALTDTTEYYTDLTTHLPANPNISY